MTLNNLLTASFTLQTLQFCWIKIIQHLIAVLAAKVGITSCYV